MARRRYLSEMTLQKFGLKMRAIRLEKGWSLEEAEAQGYPNWKHLQKVEDGKNVTFRTLVNLANLYGVTLAELLKDL